MKRVAVIGLALLAVLAAAQAGAARPRGVLAVVGVGSKARLGYANAATLKLGGKSVRVGLYTWPAALSPDGSEIALGRNNPSGLRVVDLRRMRVVKTLSLSESVSELAWAGPRRIMVVSQGLPVIAVDPVSGRRLWTADLPTFAEAMAKSAGGLVFLSAPASDYQDVMGPSVLTTISSQGVMRSVQLDRVITGSLEPSGSNPLGAERYAGLAVDVSGNRAFVIGAGEPVAEVDLATLAVTYEGGTRTLSKLDDGPYRTAAWLPNGTIAVTGYDGHVSKDATGTITESDDPAGLVILDPRDWSSKMIDPTANSLTVAGNRLLAYSWETRSGLSVYTLGGTPLLHALTGWTVSALQVGGGAAFVIASNGNGNQLVAVDLGSGRVLKLVPSSRGNILLVP